MHGHLDIYRCLIYVSVSLLRNPCFAICHWVYVYVSKQDDLNLRGTQQLVENADRVNLRGTQQLVDNTDRVNLNGENTNTMKTNINFITRCMQVG